MDEAATNPSGQSKRAILSLSWQSLAYGVGTIGSHLLTYLLVPFLTRYMPQEEYGAVSVIMSLYAFLNVLTNAGLAPSTFRFYNDSSNDEEKRSVLGSSQLLFLLYATVPAAAIVIFAKPISGLLLGSQAYALALQLAAGFLIFDSLNFFGTVVLRIQVRPLIASIQSIILIAAKMCLAILFVVFFKLGITGYWLGFIIGEFLGLLFTIWLIRGIFTLQVSKVKILDLMQFGIPLIPATLSMTALRIADRYIISSLVGLEQVAIYDVGYKVGAIINMIISPFRAAWSPFAFSNARKPEAKRIFRDVLTYLVAGCVFIILGVLAFRAELLQLMAPRSYRGAEAVVSWVAFSQVFLAVYIVFSTGPLLARENKRMGLVWSAAAAGLTNIGLNFLFIPAWGILGAAIATLVSYAALAVFVYFVARSSYPIPIDWVRLLKLSVCAIPVMLIIVALERIGLPIVWQWLARLGSLGLFPILLLLTGFIKLAQVISLFRSAKEFFNRRTTKRARESVKEAHQQASK